MRERKRVKRINLNREKIRRLTRARNKIVLIANDLQAFCFRGEDITIEIPKHASNMMEAIEAGLEVQTIDEIIKSLRHR